MPKPSRKRKQHDTDKDKDPVLYVVGIGASAGGLEALRDLLAHLDHNPRLTYVVAQHLSPTHASMLKTLLARECSLNVVELTNAQVPEPSTIYITPPNRDVEIHNGTLQLTTPQAGVGPKPSVNRFFVSLAQDQGERAVGIILSGTGADGTSGLLAIKAAGGTSLVQDPASARYDGMPAAAIRASGADLILLPARMGPALTSFVTAGLFSVDEEQGVADESVYEQIIALTRDVAGFDLAQYKSSTIERRIRRRMALQRHRDMAAYLGYLRDNSKEAGCLAQDVLISVTEFFRDPEAFEELAWTVNKLVESVARERDIRIWVPGCATGEEAYSIAILIEEAIRESGESRRYQIFATDIDTNATTLGRQGRYAAAAFEKMDARLRDRYFEEVGGEYVANKGLREHLVFSVHNLIQDPPFSRVDLISCRNLLIYFTAPLQKRVMEIFHYALNPDGFLFLGRSETVSQHKDLFRAVSKSARLFRKQGEAKVIRPFSLYPEIQAGKDDGKARVERQRADPLAVKIQQAIVRAYGPPSLVVSGTDEVVHCMGDVKPYLSIPSGPAGLSVFDLIDERLRAELRALLYKCRRELGSVNGGKHIIAVEGEERAVRPVVRPLDGEGEGLLLISFESAMDKGAGSLHDKTGAAECEDPVILELEHELATTREHLQTVVEELETSNEELQSVNEELQSSNEELQSTNEELQTSNEELQSTNEELLTVNDEVQAKSLELETLAADLQNIQDSIDFPLIVVDKRLRVTRFVPAVDQIAPVAEVHAGDAVTSLPWRGDLPCLRQTINQVMKKGEALEQMVRVDGKIYQMRVVPYSSKKGGVAGVVLLFPETTELHSVNTRLMQSEHRLQSLIDNIVDGVITIDEHSTVLSFSCAAEGIFGYSAAEVVGGNIALLMPEAEAARHHEHLQRYLSSGQARILGRRREARGRHKDGHEFPLEISVNEMRLGSQRIFTGLVRDVTERREVQEALFQEKEKAQVTLHSIADGVITTDSAGKVEYMNPVAERLTGWVTGDGRGIPISRVFRIIGEGKGEALGDPVRMALDNGENVTVENNVLLRNLRDEEFAIEYSAAPIRHRGGEMIGAVLVFHDVTEKRNLLQQMAWQARHDPLTGLVNRKELESRLERALASAKEFKREHALLYLDLDQFKIVNDTCGHRAGDELLRQIAGQMAMNLRHRDALARLGGDEFGILLENCSLSQARCIADKIKKAVQEFRFAWDEKVFRIGVSIGVAPISDASANLNDVLSDADTACYAAKESGRNRVQVHTPNDENFSLHRREMNWVSKIHRVMEENRFRLYCQRITPLDGRRGKHGEVLLRMLDGKDGVVLPGVFLPSAERYGLMQAIDRWVLRTTLAALRQHASAEGTTPAEHPCVSINLSGSSLGDDTFLSLAQEQFAASGVAPQQVCFEITETAAITNFTKAREFIREMKRLGCLFALDDFGSGMSSFGYLKSLAVDFLKIDGAFVKNVAHDVVDLAMVESINRIGHLMEIHTIAEFVENSDTLDRLRQIGVDYAQGYGVHKPAPMEEFLGIPAIDYAAVH